MTFDPKSFEIYRWHSNEYVDSWMADQEREEGRRSLRRKLISLLPFESKASIRMLDLGAGGGALSQEILLFFPKAHIVCQDFSEVMLDHAQQSLAKFKDRVTFVRSDLSTPEWAAAIAGTFEAVVSSFVMHTVPGHVREIFDEVYGLVKPGGCFLVADTSASPGPMFEKMYSQVRLKALQTVMKAETGIEKSPEEIEMELKEKRSRDIGDRDRVRNPLRRTLTLMKHLEWLREAGFAEVDCLWKDMRRAVIGGFRRQE
jgi:tRNA (cmo5U34)-methyltransferase